MSDEFNSRVRGFIVDNFLFGDTSVVPADDASLIENDIIDSTGVLELVTFLEDAFDISVDDTDIVPANLDSIEHITAFIKSKSMQTAAE